MSNLTYLNDASVLHNLKQRYYHKLIYVSFVFSLNGRRAVARRMFFVLLSCSLLLVLSYTGRLFYDTSTSPLYDVCFVSFLRHRNGTHDTQIHSHKSWIAGQNGSTPASFDQRTNFTSISTVPPKSDKFVKGGKSHIHWISLTQYT